MRKTKTKVCVVDSDPMVLQGWKNALASEADCVVFADHRELARMLQAEPGAVAQYSCVVIGRYLGAENFDVVDSNLPELLREQGVSAVFINWPGFLPKEVIENRFEGRLFNRYGVRWGTLRGRIIRAQKGNGPVLAARDISPPESSASSCPGGESTGVVSSLRRVDESAATNNAAEAPSRGEAGRSLVPGVVVSVNRPKAPLATVSFFASNGRMVPRPQRCKRLLEAMARQAAGGHREKLQQLAKKDFAQGVEFLEAIYNRLLVSRDRSNSCPSRYINSSPLIAKNILATALFGQNAVSSSS